MQRFTVTPGAAAKLVFLTSPSNAATNTPFATQPVVVVQDASGNTVTSSTAAVTLSVTGNPVLAVVTCTTNPKAAVAGMASSAGCRVGWPGTYTLTARSGTPTAGISTAFTITLF